MALGRYKARLVAKGFHQRLGVDYHEMFNLVDKPMIIHFVILLAPSQGWDLRQLDVNNKFIQGTLKEEIFMAQPQGFIDKNNPLHMRHLHKTIYGLKEAPRAWYNELQHFFTTSLFICKDKGIPLLLLVYVDDIIIIGIFSRAHINLGRRILAKGPGNP
ncbi:LOW QUALITY PROTEIN: hypothetical protein OSB04_001502 [Centaurea solstitialis]|uniref:Reverse transcriptase Ty1/copia-type domain-containing protein n=1 Tax=Centaurea solstitialis TaxID=347529 RepID=A0AA38WUY7_9ASTR|nr:LOW QUALITY PROTEIN: hypothetical protein OSB04_001502 [Centaurea solstitialis]